MSRRPANPSRRFGDSGGGLFSSSKSKASPVLSVGLIIVGCLFLIAYVYKGSGGFGSHLESVSRVEGWQYPAMLYGPLVLYWLGMNAYNDHLLTCVNRIKDIASISDLVWILCKMSALYVCPTVLFTGLLQCFASCLAARFFANSKLPNAGDYLCAREVLRAIPVLQKAYGDSLHKVLHVGPDTCYVVSKFLKEEETEAWGIEPYDVEDADGNCKALILKGIVRMADIKFPLPYRPKSFSLVIVSDALDFLSPRYLNKTLPDLARVSADGIVIFTGFPDNQKAKVADVSKMGRAAKMRSSSWWVRFFLSINLEENETASKKFAQASTKSSYISNCQIFHLKFTLLPYGFKVRIGGKGKTRDRTKLSFSLIERMIS
ncbi:putative pectin methylesterase CGR3 [Glycine max]|nr:putative pectin methylesterase CGR3 [Glycine max]